MKLTSIVLAAAMTASFALPVAAIPVTYVGTLSNQGEPAPANQSLGTGTVTIVLDETALSMDVNVTFSNLTGNVSNAHMHCCTASANTGSAGVATPLPTFPGFPGTGSGIANVKSGQYHQLFDMTLASSYNPAFITANGGTTTSAFETLAAGIASGKAYLNIHTSFVPGGEIRAFLAPVPEPETFALMLAGLVGVAAWARKRAAIEGR